MSLASLFLINRSFPPWDDVPGCSVWARFLIRCSHRLMCVTTSLTGDSDLEIITLHFRACFSIFNHLVLSCMIHPSRPCLLGPGATSLRAFKECVFCSSKELKHKTFQHNMNLNDKTYYKLIFSISC